MPNAETSRGGRERLLSRLLERHAIELSARKQDLRSLYTESADVVEDSS